MERLSRRRQNKGVHISDDLISQILSKLPVKSLLRFKCLSKYWQALLNDKYFITLHLSQSNNDSSFILYNHEPIALLNCEISSSSSSLTRVDAVELLNYPFKGVVRNSSVICSCNGIILIGNWSPLDDHGDFFVFQRLDLWNPSTKEYKVLPDSLLTVPEIKSLTRIHIAFGLGYDSSTNDFKVVRISYYCRSRIEQLRFRIVEFESRVDVYSVRKNLCERIQDIPYMIDGSRSSPKVISGIYVSGSIHWLARISRDYDDRSRQIVCFDVCKQVFKVFQLPDLGNHSCSKLGMLQTCLCVIKNLHDGNVDVFVMKEYGVVESWTKIFRIIGPNETEVPISCNILCMTSDGKLLALWDSEEIVLHDTAQGYHSPIEVSGRPYKSDMCTVGYSPSLFSLK